MDTDQNAQEEMSLQEAIKTLVADLPQPIQKFISGPERDAVAFRLSQKYNLHVDQAGEFEHAYLYMLLGVTSPEGFVQTLTSAGLPEATVQGLLQDINTEVFIPLRAQEREVGVAPAEAPSALNLASTAPPVPTYASVPTPQPAPAPIYTPSAPTYTPPVVSYTPPVQDRPIPQAPVNLPTGTSPFPPAPPVVPPAPPLATVVTHSQPVYSIPAPVTPMPQPTYVPPPAHMEATIPQIRTMAEDMQEVKSQPVSGGVSLPWMHQNPPERVIQPTAPVPPPYQQYPAAHDPNALAPTTPPVKDYGVDPYRESVQ